MAREETLCEEVVLSNGDVDVEVTSSTMILGAQTDEGLNDDADGTTPLQLHQTNVTTVPKGINNALNYLRPSLNYYL